MIPSKYQRFVFSFFMALLMSFLMSFVITLFNVGFVDNLISLWLKAWGFAFVVAFPKVTLVAPVVNKLTRLFVAQD